jgi:cytochrome P450
MNMTAPTIHNFYAFENTNGAAAANRLLFSWLSDDSQRRLLYADMIANKAPLFFSSNASRRDNLQNDLRDYDWIDGPREYYQKAVLLAHPDHVEHALLGRSPEAPNGPLDFSNSPYQGLGGFFMLALDGIKEHDFQRDFALDMLGKITSHQYDALATLAFKAGALAPLKQHEFDLVSLAESIAARYALMVFGFAQKDIGLLLDCTRKIGRGLQYQIIGRHFVFEPSTMIESRAAVARMAQRATEIMQLYSLDVELTREQKDEKEEIDTDIQRLGRYRFHHDATPKKHETLSSAKGFQPILQGMALAQPKRHGEGEFGLVEKGLIASCLVGGSVTNIQNSICICLAEIFKQPSKDLVTIRKDAIDERFSNPDAWWQPTSSKVIDIVKEAMRVTPPVVFVPRRANHDIELDPQPENPIKQKSNQIPCHIEKDMLVLVALGGASCPGDRNDASQAPAPQSFRFDSTTHRNAQNSAFSEKDSKCPFSKTFGGAPLLPSAHPLPNQRWTYTHSCPGMMMAMHVIAYSVRQLLALPSLAQKINADTGAAYGLEKRWGLQATFYPLSYQREQLLVQTPLQTVLPIKSPVDFHSQQLRQVLALGAPFIEKVLQDSQMVHFASFMFVDNDSKLILFTMYDGDFDTYIAHFAKEFGHLFDRFFSHVAITPTMPIREHPFEFVQYLKQFLSAPVEGYYFSAYPETATHQITKHFTRQYDYNLLRGPR